MIIVRGRSRILFRKVHVLVNLRWNKVDILKVHVKMAPYEELSAIRYKYCAAILPLHGFVPMQHTCTRNHGKMIMHIDSSVTQTFKQLILHNSHISI